MIQEIIDDIIDRLSGTPGIKGDPEPLAGDLDEQGNLPKQLPGLLVAYEGADFSPRKLIGAVRADHVMRVTVVLIAKSHKSRAKGAEACHTIIEAIRSKLTGYKVGAYGELWPVREALIDATGPLLVYGMTYGLSTHY